MGPYGVVFRCADEMNAGWSSVCHACGVACDLWSVVRHRLRITGYPANSITITQKRELPTGYATRSSG